MAELMQEPSHADVRGGSLMGLINQCISNIHESSRVNVMIR